MPVFVDGIEKVWGGDGNSRCLEVTQLLQQARDEGRYIRMITLNGRETAIGDFEALEFSGEDEIMVVTCTLDELVEDSMTSALEYTPKLLKAFVECAKLLRTGNVGEAAGIFSDTVQGLQWTYDVLLHLASLHPGPSPVHNLFEQAGIAIPQLFQAWDTQDYVFLADIVEYELIPLLDKWLQVTTGFASKMQAERLKEGIFQQ
jgi:hypothetical protein